MSAFTLYMKIECGALRKQLLKMLMHLLCTPLFRNRFALTSCPSVSVIMI